MSDYFSSSIFNSFPSSPHLTGLDPLSRKIYHDSRSGQASVDGFEPDHERQELWNSMSTGEKVRGTILSLLIGGGAAALIGYIMMY